MAALNIEQVDKGVCDACHLRFLCYTNRYTKCKLTINDEFLNVSAEKRRQMHIARAKKQGRYFPTKRAD